MRQGVMMDGEYYLKVKSRILQVCMSTIHNLGVNLQPPPHPKKHKKTNTHLLPRCVSPQIYCAEMQTDFPKEYVTLRGGQTENYSEVYGHRCVDWCMMLYIVVFLHDCWIPVFIATIFK